MCTTVSCICLVYFWLCCTGCVRLFWQLLVVRHGFLWHGGPMWRASASAVPIAYACVRMFWLCGTVSLRLSCACFVVRHCFCLAGWLCFTVCVHWFWQFLLVRYSLLLAQPATVADRRLRRSDCVLFSLKNRPRSFLRFRFVETRLCTILTGQGQSSHYFVFALDLVLVKSSTLSHVHVRDLFLTV